MGKRGPTDPSTPPFTSERGTVGVASRRLHTLEGLHILVVDDEDDTRELIEELLVLYGATVTVAPSADDALARLQASPPDVLLSDIGMPDRDGYWLIGRVRESFPSLPAVALTAFTRREDVARVLASGFDEHVGKPVDPVLLVERLASLRK